MKVEMCDFHHQPVELRLGWIKMISRYIYNPARFKILSKSVDPFKSYRLAKFSKILSSCGLYKRPNLNLKMQLYFEFDVVYDPPLEF